VCAEEVVAKEPFLAEYEPAVRRIQDCYNNLRMRVKAEYRSEKGTRVGEYEYLANWGLYRSDSISKGYSFVATPRGSFQAKKQQNDEYVIIPIADSYEDSVGAIRTGTRLPFAAYCMYNRTIVEMIRSDACHITSIERSGEGKSAEAKVSLQTRKGNTYWFVFAPNDGWVVKEYGHGKAPSFARANVTYDSYSSDGIPLVKRVRYWEEGPNRDPAHGITMEMVDFTLGPVSDREFEWAAFGIADVWKPDPTTYPVLLVVGATLVVLIVVVGYVMRRLEKAEVAAQSRVSQEE
jgi:hypothetical protein